MARKQAKVVIGAEGRDKGKHFLITEMAAFPLEDWAIRVFLGLAKSGTDIPDEIAAAGIAGVARMGFQRALSGISMEYLRPLLDEMLACVELIPDPAKPDVRLPVSTFPEQIEEAKTILTLRFEWVQLHVGFSLPGVI